MTAHDAAERESVFNEVIYGLGVLADAVEAADTDRRQVSGIVLALEYVKAMVEAEA